MVKKMRIVKFGDVPVYGKFIDGFGWIDGQLKNIIKSLEKKTDEEILDGDIGVGRPCPPFIKMNRNCWSSVIHGDRVEFRRYNASRILSSDDKGDADSSPTIFDNNRVVIFIGF